METKKFRKQHPACKMFAIATVVMMSMAFIACSSDDDDSKPNPNAVEYVNLGLPSRIKWAKSNLGANKPEEYGNYYAWGETKPKTTYNWSNYKWMQQGKSEWIYITKYTIADGKTEGIWYDSGGKFIGDGKILLEPGDDAATAKLGSPWRIPTLTDMQELIDNCKWEWTEVNGVKGCKGTGPNGKSIFLPAAGFRTGSKLLSKGNSGSFWSSELSAYSRSAYNFEFLVNESPTMPHCIRMLGFSVRPVRK